MSALTVLGFVLVALIASGVIGCALMLAQISRAIDCLTDSSRRVILDEVRKYAQEHEKVSLVDVLKVIRG